MLLPENPPPEDRSNSKWLAAMVTVAVHGLLIVVATFVAVIPAFRDDPELVAEVIGPVEENESKLEKEMVKKQADQVSASAAKPIAEMLRTKALAVTAAPDVKLDDSPLGLGEGDLGKGFGMNRNQNMGSGVVFFGQKVRGKLGVVFDVSGSMHEYVPIVVDEIQREFRDVPVVCVGTSLFLFAMGEPEAIPYRDADSTNSMRTSKANRDEVEEQMDRDLLALPNCYFMSRDQNTLGHATEYLMNEGVGSIFIFSDFRDSYNADYLEKLTARAKAESVSINLHALEEFESSFNKIRKENLEKLAKETNGALMIGELVKRAGRR